MKNILSVIVLIFFLSISCQRNVTTETILIVPSDNDNIAAVIDDIEFIPLETNEDSIIGKIYRASQKIVETSLSCRRILS